MITRIVRLTIQPEKAAAFLERFNNTYSAIRNFKGCSHLRLFSDAQQPNIFITYSHWENEEALEHYRLSALFQSTWSEVKPMFAAAPVAFSMNEIVGDSSVG